MARDRRPTGSLMLGVAGLGLASLSSIARIPAAQTVGVARTTPSTISVMAQEPERRRAYIDGSEPGWRALEQRDFAVINGDADTWAWSPGLLRSTGKPIGVMCTERALTNFELVLEWRHLESGGNSGAFAWVPAQALAGLKPGVLPERGIEIQMLDHGYAEKYQKQSGRRGDWFTTNGDVFAVGTSRLSPFPPTSPDGSRSFPRRNLSRGVGEWNHYYVRAINGEIRLWVNGEEVSGGRNAEPRAGELCLEAEGAPVEFRNLRLRELP